jgi:hypothetical protein
LGRYSGDDGPTLICIAAIHGNEPAGVHGLRRVFERLEERRPPFRGTLVGITGNLTALAHGKRFLDKDLNRHWKADYIVRISRHAAAGENGKLGPEDRELLELREAIHDALPETPHPVHFLDVHTTSSQSVPFAVIGDTLPNRRFALRFGVPVILGFEEYLEGTLPEYAYELGCITMGFEAGRHDDPASVDHAESALWVALEAAGILSRRDWPEIKQHRRRLHDVTKGVPRFLEIFDRHPVEQRDAFEMQSGYVNFQSIEAGQVLARDYETSVHAADTAVLFMPLYQDQGEDGFFLTRPVRPFWMKVSGLLRRMHLGAIAPWLPGVQRHPTRPNTVMVEPHIARWHVVQIFHLLGYRHRRSENGKRVFSRRQYDVGQKRAPLVRRSDLHIEPGR